MGFTHVLTLRWVILKTVCLACAGDIIHLAARVNESMGAVLREMMCPFNVVSTLETTS